MRDKRVIYHGSPCLAPLTSPAIRTWDDLVGSKPEPCQFHGSEAGCSPPRYGCVPMAGQKVARYVLEFYAEASDETLDMEIEQFRQYAPLPPDRAEAYIDGRESGYSQLKSREQVVRRVREYARSLLNLQPGERMFRSPEERLDARPAGRKDAV